MKQSCPKCHSILEIDENDYTPGEDISIKCPICGEIIKFIIPFPEDNLKDSATIPDKQGQGETTPKKVVRVRATESEKRLAEKQKQEILQKTEPNTKKDKSKGNSRAIVFSILGLLCVVAVAIFFLFYNNEESSSGSFNQSSLKQDDGMDMIIDFYNNYVFEQKSEHPLTYYCMPTLVKEATYEHPEFGEVVNMSRFAGFSPDGPFDGKLIDVINDGDQWYSVIYTEQGESYTTRVLVAQDNGRFKILKTIPLALKESTELSQEESLVKEESYTDSDYDDTIETVQRDTNGHSCIDLGLPSGVCWATCNLGAQSSSDYGEHFAWGETSNKFEYTQSSYSQNLGSGTLSLDYDAAAQQWGGTWRIPTKEDWQELINCCKWSWNGTGYRITGQNGNTIFLPASGYSKGSSRFKEGERGDYWTSTPFGSEKAYEFVIKSDTYGIESDNRFYGISIRPVTN